MSAGARLHELFFAAAERFPDHTALETVRGEKTSYRELQARVQETVALFTRNGIGRGARLALLAKKSPELVAAMLAASATGAAYIPIDPSAPAERIRFLLRDLDPHALVCDPELFPSGIPCQQQEMIAGGLAGELGFIYFGGDAHADDLAYLLYTSGSTGQPKGVCITQENATAFVRWGIQTFHPAPGTRFSSIAPFHFDLSVFDLYVALATGGTVLLLDDETVKNARLLTQLLAEKQIHIAYATPSTWRAIHDFGKPAKFDFSSLKQLLFAGEVFPPQQLAALAGKMNGDRRYFNLYGPTETNVCLFSEIVPEDFRRDEFPLGKTWDPLETRIDGGEDEGELLVSGPQVFAGYWNRPEKTAEVFSAPNGRRWYRTGDRVYRDADGVFFFRGRIDRMIKKRGYRIEPGEVEAAVMRHSQVLECAVLEGKDADGYALLLAFVSATASIGIGDLRDHCAALLPSYMLPDRLVLTGELPKTSTGKIDYATLRSQANHVK